MFKIISTLSLALLLIALTLTIPPEVRAQGSKDDYARADDLRKLTSGKVFRDRVTPNWIGESSSFWYFLRSAKDQHRFILVNPAEKSRLDAFDHSALAAALTENLGKEIAADQLPFRTFDFIEDGSAITFSAGGSGFRYDLTTGSLAEVKPTASANGTTVKILPAIRAARSNRGDTEITFINKTEHEIRILWIGDPDNPTAYGTVSAGERIDQHTFAGHVWLVKAPDETTLGVFEATETPGVAVIDGTWEPGQGDDEDSSRQRRRSRDRDREDRATPEVASPDGRWKATIRDHNVVLIDTDSNESSVLSQSGSDTDPFRPDIRWAPNSKRMIVIQERQAPKRTVNVVESSPEDQLQPKLHGFDYVKPGDAIDHPRPRLFDVEKQQQLAVDESLFPDPWRLSEYRWSPDGTQFSFLYNQRGHQVLRLIAIDAANGSTATLIEETPDTFVCYSSKTFYRPVDDTHEIIWMSERDGWNHLYLFDSSTGNLKNQITKGDWVVREVDRVDIDKRQIWFQAGGIYPDQDPYHIHYCRVNFDGTDLTTLTDGDGTHSVAYSPDSDYFVDTWSRVDLPPVTELRRSSDGAKVMDLEKADASALESVGWRTPERFTAKGRDGTTDIWGVIYKPTTFDPNNKYPVIEKIYAGPHSAHVPKRFSANGSPMAELGFIVVQIDGMGTSHRSKAFHDVCWQDIGDAGFPDRVRWIKAAAESRPWMDLSRVGIYGGSAGGQNAMRALIAHHDFYHVAVADCGCHDNRMDKIWWNEQWMGYPVADHYAASSNVDQAHRLQGKLMLIVGELDRNVDPASTMQVANALVKADKDFDLVIIPGAGHGAAGTPYGRRRQRDFFVRHLLGVEPGH